MNTRRLFEEELSVIPNDVKIEIDTSFAIADKIDGILKERGMSQKDFARKMGRSEAEISRWLGGTHNFTLRTLSKISAALNISIITV